MTVTFSVVGIPQPSGSKRAFPIKRKDGSIDVAVSEDAKGAKAWRQDVAAAAAGVFGGAVPLDGPLSLSVVFMMPRPKGHFGKRGLRPGAPGYPAVRPDATKLLRAVEDALTGILWRDDAQIVGQHIVKRYTVGAPGASVTVAQLVGGLP